MTSRPKRWIAVVLSILLAPLGMLYLGRGLAALAYLVALVVSVLADFLLSMKGFPAFLALIVTIFAAIHAYRLATAARLSVSRPWFSRWYGLVAVVVSLIVATTLLRAFILEPFRVRSDNMHPSLARGSHILIAKFGFGNYEAYGLRIARTRITVALKRGDIVAFEHPRDRSLKYVMRLVGLPGDRLEYRGKRLFVNENLITQGESAGPNPALLAEIQEGAAYRVVVYPNVPARDFKHEVKAGLFVLGDNRDHSSDSRHWDEVPYDHLLGRVVYIIRP